MYSYLGSHSYSSSQTKPAAPPVIQTGSFLQTTYYSFDAGDESVILRKLKEFNEQSGTAAVDTSILEGIIQLCTGPALNLKYLDELFNLCNWPDGM